MTKKSSLYFGLADADVRPNFKFSQVRAETNQITHLNSQSDCALKTDKDEEIMDNSECPENQDLPVESTHSNKIIRLLSLSWRLVLAGSSHGFTDGREHEVRGPLTGSTLLYSGHPCLRLFFSKVRISK